MKKFTLHFLMILFGLALFLSVTTTSPSSDANQQLSSFDNKIASSEAVNDGELANPKKIESTNDNLFTKASYSVSNGLSKAINKSFNLVKKTIKSFLK